MSGEKKQRRYITKQASEATQKARYKNAAETVKLRQKKEKFQAPKIQDSRLCYAKQ